MASSEVLQRLLDQAGMPDQQWWNEAECAYDSMCKMLTEDINTGDQRNHSSRPMVVICPTGNYACKLSSRSELLNCVAFGTIRADLFVEVAWQNITRAQDNGLEIKVYEVTERRILLDIFGYRFSLHYVESPELVRQFPAIVDVSRAVQEELRDEISKIVEAIRDVELIAHHIEKDSSFSQIYHMLRAWMVSNGLYQIDRGGQSLRLFKKSIACFNGDLLRELTWNIQLVDEREHKPGHIAATVSSYLRLHDSCLGYSTKDNCSFYNDRQGPFARYWSDSHFRIIHQQFLILNAALTGTACEESDAQNTDGSLFETLKLSFLKPLADKFMYNSYIRVTMQYSGQSQQAGTKMMQFVEERILDLVHALENSIEEKVHCRPWPTRLVEVNANELDHPYEGYWLVGINVHDSVLRKELEGVLNKWNDKICVSHRYSPSTMVIHGELISRNILLQQDLKEDPRDWPLTLAKPDPRYTLDRITEDTTEVHPIAATPTGLQRLQSPRKLRPAMDVLSRLKHDPAFDLDDHVVGYTDRHAGIQEKAVGSWVSESTDEEFIPQGRIQFFRRVSDGKKVWDRSTKYDCIFR